MRGTKDEPIISIIIPVKDGEPWIRQCIEGILSQTISDIVEIIALDSGSRDNTRKILSGYPVNLIDIPPSEFNHGRTRNVGVKAARGKFVLLTVQDAAAYDRLWVERLYDVLKDESVAAVCGSQVVPHNCRMNPVEWFRPVSRSSIRTYQLDSNQPFGKYSPFERRRMAGWDDVNAMYRRSALLSLPFREVVYGEDAYWAKDALEAGFKIAYQPEARVYHYHQQNYDYAFKRFLTTMYLRYKAFEYIEPYPSLDARKLKGFVGAIFLKGKGLDFSDKVKWFRYNITVIKARQAAHRSFTKALELGEEELMRTHEKFCGKPPVPLS